MDPDVCRMHSEYVHVRSVPAIPGWYARVLVKEDDEWMLAYEPIAMWSECEIVRYRHQHIDGEIVNDQVAYEMNPDGVRREVVVLALVGGRGQELHLSGERRTADCVYDPMRMSGGTVDLTEAEREMFADQIEDLEAEDE